MFRSEPVAAAILGRRQIGLGRLAAGDKRPVALPIGVAERGEAGVAAVLLAQDRVLSDRVQVPIWHARIVGLGETRLPKHALAHILRQCHVRPDRFGLDSGLDEVAPDRFGEAARVWV